MTPVSPHKPSAEVLRKWYVEDRQTARAIAERCKVRHITVLRWMRAAGIERRHERGGLYRAGRAAPSADELHDLVHVQHLSYQAIGDRYGVDQSAVQHWLKRHGIPLPKVWATRRKGVVPPMPSEAELRHRISLGHSLRAIAREYHCDHGAISNRCRQYGIEVARDGWRGGHRFPCLDGHEARSVYEQRVDDWLHQHGVPHEIEPAYPWDRRYRADFRVGQTYIEVWGVTNSPTYTQRKTMKTARCKQEGIDLIGINSWQFAKGRRWWKPLQRLVSEQSRGSSESSSLETRQIAIEGRT